MTKSELQGWLALLGPETDAATVCVLSSISIPFAATSIVLAGASDGSGMMLAVTGPGQRVCGDWQPLETIDLRPSVLCEPRDPSRLQHPPLNRFMAGFCAGAAGAAFDSDDHADLDWKSGYDAGRAAYAAVYAEGCAIYNTELHLERMRGRVRAAAVSTLIDLAKLCPQNYPDSDVEKWGESPAVKALILALEAGGFPHLALAVDGGSMWPLKIAAAKDEIGIQLIEQEATGPEWSWNQE